MEPQRGTHQQAGKEFIAALTSGDLGLAKSLVTRRVRTPTDLQDVYLTAFEPASLEVLRLQNDGQISAANAHAMTMAIQELIEGYSPLVFGNAADGPRALIAGMPNDLTDVPARVIADLCEIEGFDTQFVSSPPNANEIFAHLEEEDFDLLVIVITNPANTDSVLAIVEEARRRASRIEIVAGGAGLESQSFWPLVSLGYSVFLDAGEAVALAKSHIGSAAIGSIPA